MQVSKDCGFALHGWSRTRYFLISGSKDCGFDSLYGWSRTQNFLKVQKDCRFDSLQGWSRTHNFLKVQKIVGSTPYTGGVEPTIFFIQASKDCRFDSLHGWSRTHNLFYLRFKRLRVRLPSRVESNPQYLLSKVQTIAGSTPFTGGV